MSPGTNIKTLKIDGKDFSARQDETILDVARQNKIFIPTLCDLRGLSTVGACRLCLVEVKGSNKLLPSCVTRVEEGMEVTTTSERLDRYRRSILELLFTERNHICSVCVSNGHCELQTLAQRLEITHVHYPYRYPKVAGGCFARPLHRRPQPLHSVHALRSRVRRNRRRPYLGRDGPRHRGQGHHRSQPALGIVGNLHRLRQVRTRMPHRRIVREGPVSCRNAQAPSVPALPDADAGGTRVSKIRLATVWLDGCSGCHMSFLDMDERLITLAEKVDLVYSPLVDVKIFPDEVDITLVEGAVSSEEDLHKILSMSTAHQDPGFAGRLRRHRQCARRCAIPSA